MKQKSLVLCVCCVIVLVLAQVTAAQVGALHGHVLLEQAAGKAIPIAGAAIDVFRVDLSGRYNTRTDANGEFVFAGLPYIGEYLVAASAPGAKPGVIANVKVGRDIDYKVILETGDGTRFTMEEAGRAALVEAQKSPRAETDDEILSRIFRKGNDARLARHYDEAIKLFDEGLAVKPDEPVLFLVKSRALRERGVERFNTAIFTHDETEKSAKLSFARRDFREAAECANRAVDLINLQLIPADEKGRATQQQNKIAALRGRAESMRLLAVNVDPEQATAALTAFQEYIDAQDDPGQKSKAELDAGRMLVGAKAYKPAIEQYRHILVSDPQNLEAIFGYGFALFQSGDKTRFSEAARYLKLFLERAPESDPWRQEAAETLEKLNAHR